MHASSTDTANAEWLFYAISSGVCAALNGALAKLTTTSLTHTWAMSLSEILLGSANHDETIRRGFEILFRGSFFALNLMFNGVMWGLFTKALTLASSTTRVSVINTSANFVVAALIGWVVFGEELPALWWLGASLLVAGSVVIGQREEAAKAEEAKVSKEGETVDADVTKGKRASTSAREALDSPGMHTRSKDKRTTRRK